MFESFNKLFQSYKLPEFDNTKFSELQKRNIELFTANIQSYSDSMQEIARKSGEYAQKNFEDALEATREVFSTSTPEQNTAKQTDFVKKSTANYTKQARELTELSTQTHFKTLEKINKHIDSTAEEVKKMAKKAA